MILIADSGSTKTDWRLIDAQNHIHQFSSVGINPYFHTAETVYKALGEINFNEFSPADISEVHFYGAGISADVYRQIMTSAFEKFFAGAAVHLHHDLLGAARALFINSEGLAVILGTGSNTCLYDGTNIVQTRGGHGYILGDEGSGMYMGRKLVQDFMCDLLPDDLHVNFVSRFGLTKDQISVEVYKGRSPNRFLASFSKFIYQNIGHTYCQELVVQSFRDFFERNIVQYPNYARHRMRVVGSVGYYYSNILRPIASEYGIEIDKIIETPISGLALYHAKENF